MEADNDGSGEVEWSEFLGLWQKVKHLRKVAEVRALFDEFDTDGGGCVDAKEIRSILTTIGLHPSKIELERMIAAVDDENNGEVEFDEFLHLWEDIAWQHKYKNRMIQLRRKSTENENYFNSEQLRRILLGIDDMQMRVETFLCFYERILDEENLFLGE
jgi:hypothetical protein